MGDYQFWRFAIACNAFVAIQCALMSWLMVCFIVFGVEVSPLILGALSAAFCANSLYAVSKLCMLTDGNSLA
jgi:hypothetical protein